MLDIKEIEAFYEERERYFKRHLLREYLQHKILQIIFNSKEGSKLTFLGCTCLRIVYGNKRFSEDLDFDNIGLKIAEFENLSKKIKMGLELEGYKTEIKNVSKGAYRCYIRFPSLLFKYNLSGYEEEKILIQIDAAPHDFIYKPEIVLLNKFEITTNIKVTAIDILLSQKINAILSRKTPKGRDFYDVIFLIAKTKPNYDYLSVKKNIKNGADLKKRLLKFCENLNFDYLTKDVKPFLIYAEEANKVRFFKKLIEQAVL